MIPFDVRRITQLFLIGYLPVTVAMAQVLDSTDSLDRYLKTHVAMAQKPDTAYVRTMAEYAYGLLYQKNDPQRADSLARQAERLARQLNFGPGVYQALVTQGGAQIQLNRPEEAIRRFRQLLRDVDRYALRKQYQCRTLANMGVTYRLMSRTKEALDVTMLAAQIEARYAIRPRNENLHRTLGFLFRTTGQTDKAISYVREGIAIAQENKDPNSEAMLEADLGALYSDRKQYAKAISAYNNALIHSRQGGYESVQVDALNGLSNNYNEIGRPQQALTYARQALTLAKKLDFTHNIANAHYSLGAIYSSLKQYATAETELLQAAALAKKADNLNNQALFVSSLAEVLAQQHKYQKAYTYQRQAQALADSVMSSEQKARTSELVARYETEKKESQITLLRQQAQLHTKERIAKRWQTTALLITGVLLLLLSVAVSAWLLNRARLRRLQEAQDLRKQIAHDLHDEVGSTISSISLLSGLTNTMLQQNRPETAGKMMQKIYTDARQILDAIDEIIWTINPSNDSLVQIALRLREYAQPLMESKNIQFNLITDPQLVDLPISMEVRRNLYLIGKEAINNLVKYANATTATIRFERQGNNLTVLIEDNGRGFDPAAASTRTGQTSMRERAEAMLGRLEVASGDNQGTTLRLSVPLI